MERLDFPTKDLAFPAALGDPNDGMQSELSKMPRGAAFPAAAKAIDPKSNGFVHLIVCGLHFNWDLSIFDERLIHFITSVH
ncbi:MAG: hypothetical protein JNM63_11220 [Spirochaetia bacterium]|nr:hypothetical protein [Spirochaetia bacterium]